MAQQRKENHNVRSKVIIVFLLGCMAIIGAWITSRNAFEQVLFSVDNISKPNEKLILVSHLSRQIMQLDQLQRTQAFHTKSNALSSFEKESKLVALRLDTLKNMYAYDPNQVKRIDSIKTILREREKLFKSYIRVRDRLVDNDEFTEQLQSIGNLVQDQAENVEERVVTTEKRNQTTTVTDEGSNNNNKRDERSFFSKIFGRKAPQQEEESKTTKTIQDEINVLIDSIKVEKKDSLLHIIDSTLKRLDERQRQQSTNFVNREIELTIAGNYLVNNMLTILQAVEQEGEAERTQENQQARMFINGSIDRLNLILIAFLFITAIMVLTILADIRKANKNRKELIRAKEEAEYHSAAKQRFLSNMSHELRTPLQSIIGYTEQARDAQYATPQQIDVIYRSSEHLLQIVNEVLDYNRINSGKFNFETKAFDLDKLVDEVTESMRVQAEQKQLHFFSEKKFDKNVRYLGDPFRIKQILFNLVSNAIKFTSAGQVHLYTRVYMDGDEQKFIIQVEDSGKGIPQEDLGRIFNEFEQAGNSNSGVHFGSGLGLSIVKTLCEAMHGSIQVKSKVGQGSVFTVSIPLETADSSVAIPSDDDSLIPSSSFKGTVWIVDDDEFILSLSGNILSKHHISHQLFSSPAAILAQPVDPNVTHVIMDMRMPGMTGMELLDKLKKKINDENPNRQVNMSAFTAQALPEERQHILDHGFDQVLVKPIKEAELLRLLGVSAKNGQEVMPTPTSDLENQSLPFSLDKLRQFAMNDEFQMRQVLQLYIKDTTADLTVLQEAINAGDNELAGFIFHRLAGRTGQLGHDKLCIKLRKMEIDLKSSIPADTKEISTIVKEVTELLDLIGFHLQISHAQAKSLS
ncbi:ATP-binding protein [Olivibacter sitiensis]|uniref:ATP-binding protein n=1 Tax=Olivibacter sitiensis TaxID=376470 RepID=UPI00041E73A4|nr:ATP-binding protein [Olivibacter sitiensis]